MLLLLCLTHLEVVAVLSNSLFYLFGVYVGQKHIQNSVETFYSSALLLMFCTSAWWCFSPIWCVLWIQGKLQLRHWHGSWFSTIQINCHFKVIIDFKTKPKSKLMVLNNLDILEVWKIALKGGLLRPCWDLSTLSTWHVNTRSVKAKRQLPSSFSGMHVKKYILQRVL